MLRYLLVTELLPVRNEYVSSYSENEMKEVFTVFELQRLDSGKKLFRGNSTYVDMVLAARKI